MSLPSTEEFSVQLWMDDAPPSLNVVAGRGHWARFHRAKKLWQATMGVLLMAEQLPRGVDRVTATATLTFGLKRRRDEGNHRGVLEKALGDALVEGGWIEDDTPEHYSFGEVVIKHDPSLPHWAKRTQVYIKATRGEK